MDESACTDSDDDLFPVCGPAAAGVLHTDEYGVVYVCDRVPGAGVGVGVPGPGGRRVRADSGVTGCPVSVAGGPGAPIPPALIDRLVQVSGEGQFERGSDQPKRVILESLEAIKEVAGIDPRSIHDHMTWQELAAQQGVGPLSDPGELAGVFEDDDELDAFLSQIRPGQDLAF